MIDISLRDQVAVLIDADNMPVSCIERVNEFSRYFGKVVVCRAYGDWTKAPLLVQRDSYAAHGVRCIQVDRVGKDATDHRLLIEIGYLSAQDFAEPDVNIFVIVSGDGGFTSACDYINDHAINKGRAIGIGSRKNTADALRTACNQFYFLEDLDQELAALKNRNPIPPDKVRDFDLALQMAYLELTGRDNWVSVPFSQLGAKLHELYPDYKSRFGTYPLAQWLANFEKNFEIRDQTIRRIDPHPEWTRRSLLLAAYLKTSQDGRAHLSAIGTALRRLARDYEEQFGAKKLSAWIRDYPEDFILEGGFVIHQRERAR